MPTGPERYRRGIAAAHATLCQPCSHIAMPSCGIPLSLGLVVLALLLTACEKKEEAAKPGPPEVGVVDALAAGRSYLRGMGGATAGAGQCRDHS